MTAKERYNVLLKQLLESGVTVEPKASKWYWKAMHYILLCISFGNINFLHSSVTTVGNRIGTFVGWSEMSYAVKYEILLHEAVHVAQYKRYGFGNPWLGLVPVGFAYLFLPFPVGIAWFRAKLEQEAYEESIRAIIQLAGVEAARYYKRSVVRQFNSVNYLWMWPFKRRVEKWYDSALARVMEDEGFNEK